MSDRRERPQCSKKGPNVKPKLESKGSLNLGTDRRQRAEKPIRRSRSNDAENRRREGSRGRERVRKEGERRRRGRSEEGRKQGRDFEHGNHKPQDDLEDTECIVCFCNFDNVFKAPKLLSCGHTFCLECLARINVNSPEIKTLTCPICREVTEIRHGRDLPHLLNNQDIVRKLPSEMQRALSVRFKRSKGKLVLKNPPNNSIKTSLSLPVLKKKEEQAGGNANAVMEEGLSQATMIDVGRPPSRMRGRMRRMLYSNQCYYTVVAAIITITVALMLVGIFTFVVMPYMHKPNKPLQNQTSSDTSP